MLYAVKNGYYIPFLYFGTYIITNDLFLSTTIALKVYPINYFYWFNDKYSYLPNHNWVKQFVRFTDSGHIVSFLYYFYPKYLPLAFTIHYVITFGYWTGRILLQMEDSDKLYIHELDSRYENIWSSMLHSFPLILLSHEIITKNECVPFGYENLKLSYAWEYFWFFCIYIPWRFYTGDCVYDIFSHKNSWKKIAGFLVFIHFTTLMGNFTGYYLRGC